MKHSKYIIGLLIVMVTMNSCLLTFYPIYTPDDVVYDGSFLGSYENKDASDGQSDEMHIMKLATAGITLPEEISRIRDKGYLIRFVENDGKVTSEFIAFMVVLNNKQYIDFFPYIKNVEQFGAYGNLKVPMHAVYRIALQNGRLLTLRRFNQEFLLEMISKKQIRLQHEKIDGKYVITASTRELQQYITKYGDREEAYKKETEIYTKK